MPIPRGQTLAIIGESGCGKTVLLKTIIGLLHPTSGHVVFDGQRIDQLSDKDLTTQRSRFGFLFQNAALFDSMTVADNVAFPLRENSRMPAEKICQIVEQRLAQVGLPTSVLGKRPAQLSGGMRKRVGLARALAMSPEVLLYDEPTTGLDPIMSDVINELIIRTRQQQSVTSIVVTHDMKTAQKVADRVVMLYPAVAARAERIANHLRRHPRRDHELEGQTRVAIRPRRSGRATGGNAEQVAVSWWLVSWLLRSSIQPFSINSYPANS